VEQVGPPARVQGPPSPPAAPSVITRPDWLRQPSADQLAREYPDRALRLDREGRVQLSCTVAADGKVNNCSVTSETPTGMGFGEAALKLTRYFQMRPQTVDGAPVGGAKVNIGIPFKLE
jgi:protein TonB